MAQEYFMRGRTKSVISSAAGRDRPCGGLAIPRTPATSAWLGWDRDRRVPNAQQTRAGKQGGARPKRQQLSEGSGG